VSSEEERFEALLECLLSESREELVRADAKAATLLAAFGLLTGIVLAALFAGNFKPGDLPDAARLSWWLGCTAVGLALLSLGRAIYPTLKHQETEGPITYFGHAAGKDAAAVETALKRQLAGGRSRTVEQLVVVSDIAWRKYRQIQFALLCFAIGTALCLLGVLGG
jgi:pycsar effector protein